MGNEQNKLSVILALFGQYENLVDNFDKKIDELKSLDSKTEIIIVADGNEWTYNPLFQMLPILLQRAKIIVTENETHLPAFLYNEGLKKVNSEYILFTHLYGENIYDICNIYYNTLPHMSEVLYIRNESKNILGIFPSNQNRYGFAQIDRFYDLDTIITSLNVIKKINGFNPIPLLQKDFDRELILKLSKIRDFEEIGVINSHNKSFNNYPYNKTYCNKQDLIDRYIIRSSRPAFDFEPIDQLNQSFANDLNDIDETIFCSFTGRKANDKLKYNNKYKIMVLGGFWEYHHNQICFFNYFENIVGQGFCTYNTKFEYNINQYELLEYDIVIFSRCRSDNAVELIDFCNKNEITTIYMIDDNWITIANDLPVQGSIFVEGNPNYDNFMKAISKCKYTWLFNDYLAEDISPFVKKIFKFKISIESKLFLQNHTENCKIKIGFSGSLRSEDIAFRALARLAEENRNIIIVLIGIVSESQRNLFKNCVVEEVGFSSYSLYAKNISKIHPDLLIAPLTRTRTEKSKCYNKYVESAIIHSACLFSKTQPYSDIIKEGYNGFFVDEETESGWYKKLKYIVSNIDLLRTVQDNAYNDVIRNHTVEALIPEFTTNLENIAKEE